ncbi:MAG TPA: hypothetical protein PKY13_16190 [Microthrixaceae bacterium]|nr:hypothetical protein [Microthrixaceae bacterium]HQF96645.1 hypothetical protein [Microthrixaceae bacterium]
MDEMLFDQVAEVTRSMVPDDLGVLHLRARRWALKAWFGPAEPVKEHYEAQLLGRQHVPGATALGLEIGFHAEHRDPADNDACLTRIQRAADWRAELGPEAEVGGFIGRPDQWRRVSEIWVDPDLSDDGIAWEIAARLTDYIVAIEPHR